MIGLALRSQRGLITWQPATQAEEQPNALLVNDWNCLAEPERGFLTWQPATQAEEQPNTLLLNVWICLAEPEGSTYLATCYTS